MTKRVRERLAKSIIKFQEILKLAKDRDVNESDTVSIIKDMLAEIFGYDKYIEITSEFAVRTTFCDLAIKIDGKVEFLIEAKAAGIELKESHLRQAIEYGANNGVPWVILTNSINWSLYKIKFEQPINYDLVCTFDFLQLDGENEEHLEKLFVLCKEGLARDAREEFHDKMLTVNRFMISALILGEKVVSRLRRELRKISDGILVEPEEIIKLLSKEVLKRDVIEGEEAIRAQSRVKKFYARSARRTKEQSKPQSEEEAKEDSLQSGDSEPLK